MKRSTGDSLTGSRSSRYRWWKRSFNGYSRLYWNFRGRIKIFRPAWNLYSRSSTYKLWVHFRNWCSRGWTFNFSWIRRWIHVYVSLGKEFITYRDIWLTILFSFFRSVWISGIKVEILQIGFSFILLRWYLFDSFQFQFWGKFFCNAESLSTFEIFWKSVQYSHENTDLEIINNGPSKMD